MFSLLTNGIGGSLLALLVHAEVSGDCAMCCLTFHCSPIRTYQDTSHHPKTAIACKQGGGRKKQKEPLSLGGCMLKSSNKCLIIDMIQH